MVFQAGFVSLIRTILIIVLIFYGFRLLARFVLPFLIGRFIRKQQDKFYGQQSTQNYDQDEEGKVRVKSKKSNSNKKDELGDYVDYEEID